MTLAPRRIWVRFGLSIAVTVLLTLALLTAIVLMVAPAGDLPTLGHVFGRPVSLLLALAVCLPLGLSAGFWVSRTLTQPLDSIAAAAQRIAQGVLAVRADPGNAGGEMAALVGHFNDMARALETNERERKAMVAAISHELRTPLTVLCARLHAACDGVVTADRAELARLLGQAEHLSRLVDDLHTLTLAEAGRLPLRRAAVDLAALARDALQRHGPRLAAHGISARVSGGGEPLVVDGDADRLRQVLSNLIENATRHASAGGWLDVAVARRDASAVLCVSDAGGGRPDALRHHLRRGLGDPAQPRMPAAAGSGLGLAIVVMLVRAHGGSVDVAASRRDGSDVGVAVEVRLPLAVA